jgi:hypothetical protein
MRGELSTTTARACARETSDQNFWSAALAVASDQDLQAVAWVALIGILLTINVVLRFPNFGQEFATLAIFS